MEYNNETLFNTIELISLHPYGLHSLEKRDKSSLVLFNWWFNLGIRLPLKWHFSIDLDWKQEQCIIITSYFIKPKREDEDYFFKSIDLPWKCIEYQYEHKVNNKWVPLPKIEGVLGYQVRQQFIKYCDKYELEIEDGKIIAHAIKHKYCPRWIPFKNLFSKIIKNDNIRVYMEIFKNKNGKYLSYIRDSKLEETLEYTVKKYKQEHAEELKKL